MPDDDTGYLEELSEADARQLSNSYVVLAAELLRYIRGGGDGFRLRKAVQRAGELTDHTKDMMQGNFEQHIWLLKEWKLPFEMQHQPELYSAQESVVKGSLQYVASRLDHHSPSERRGENELRGGIYDYLQRLEEKKGQ